VTGGTRPPRGKRCGVKKNEDDMEKYVTKLRGGGKKQRLFEKGE